ncbi:MAG: hypothetical protein J5600_02035, partial [Desulfovibrio sp.]|nr:hypothetical protein [Desulfovibrio sp.]
FPVAFDLGAEGGVALQEGPGRVVEAAFLEADVGAVLEAALESGLEAASRAASSVLGWVFLRVEAAFFLGSAAGSVWAGDAPAAGLS